MYTYNYGLNRDKSVTNIKQFQFMKHCSMTSSHNALTCNQTNKHTNTHLCIDEKHVHSPRKDAYSHKCYVR